MIAIFVSYLKWLDLNGICKEIDWREFFYVIHATHCKIPQLEEQRTRPAVSLSGPLKFGGAGPTGPLKKMTKKRPAYKGSGLGVNSMGQWLQ